MIAILADRDGILVSHYELTPMLHIGKRSFIPVSAQCGIHLQVDPIVAAHSRQVWRIDAAFVPTDDRARVECCADAWFLEMSWDRLSQLPVNGALSAFMLRRITECSERIYLSLSIRASPPDPGTRRVP
jgi:hypothetical protein